MNSTPVLIVGGGPVGLCLSIDLSWRGIPHMLIDRGSRASRAEHPRMDQVSIRSMEHIRRWGVLADIERAGFPRDIQRDIVFATGVLGFELDREPMEADATRPAPSFSPQKHELCPQNFLDPALQVIAERSSIAHIRYDSSLIGLAESANGIVADIETASGRERVEAQYLAGCDGAGSFVARAIGVGAEKATLLAQSTNIFVRSQELTERASANPAYRYMLVDETGVWGSMINMSGRDVWRVQVLGELQGEDWDERRARAIVEKAIGAPVDYELLSIVPWARRELIADRFSRGRCFLVGDAAHQLSPTGGYGMNTGIGEAVDLSWKLAATLEGWGGPELLASYEIERRPIAIRNAARSTVNFQRMKQVRGDPRMLRPGNEGEAVRRDLGRAIKAIMSEEWESMGIHLGYSYADSPVIAYDGSDPVPDDPVQYRQSSRPGSRAPHVWLADGTSTLDLFGRGFTLLVFDPAADPEPIVREATARAMPLTADLIDDAEAAKAYEKVLVLVRPDGHVAWRGDACPADIGMILDRIRGAGEGFVQTEDHRVVSSSTA